MSCGGDYEGLEAASHDGPDSGSVREQRRLSVESRGKIFSRAFETERAQRKSERLVDLFENTARLGKYLRDILAHSRLLRSLAGEKENDLHFTRSG
jgi:hypothetical protein